MSNDPVIRAGSKDCPRNAFKKPPIRTISRGAIIPAFSKGHLSLSASADLCGAAAALVTTLCWLPQMLKMLRERQAAGVSLLATSGLASGAFLWFIYGLMIGSWPVIMANGVTLVFILAIVGLKLRYG